MAYTSSDLQELKDALASGALSVQFADGKRVQYRSISELMRAIQFVERELSAAEGRRQIRGVRVNVSKGV